MTLDELKIGQLYYIRAKYLRGFKRYFGLTTDLEKKVLVQIKEVPSHFGWNTVKVICPQFKNPKSYEGIWYLEGRYVKYLEGNEISYKYYLKIRYVDDKYGKNRNRILLVSKDSLYKIDFFKQINKFKPYYLPISSKTNKKGFELVEVKDCHKIAYDEYDKQLYENDKWLLDEEYNNSLGILERDIKDPQNVYSAYVELKQKSNTFCEEEYDRLEDEWVKAKNDVAELKITVAELKDANANKDKIIKQIEESAKKTSAINELKTKNYIELLRKYNELHNKYEETENKQNCTLENCSNEGTINPDDTNVYGSKLSDVRKIKELEEIINDLKLMLAERDLELYKLRKDK